MAELEHVDTVDSLASFWLADLWQMDAFYAEFSWRRLLMKEAIPRHWKDWQIFWLFLSGWCLWNGHSYSYSCSYLHCWKMKKKKIITTKNELKILWDTYLLLLLLLLEFCCTLLIKDTAKLSKAIRKVNTRNIFHTKNCFTLTAMGVSGSQLDLMDLEWIKRFSSEISIKSKWIWVTFTGGQIEWFVIIAVESILLRCWLSVAVFSSKNCTSRWIACVPLEKL